MVNFVNKIFTRSVNNHEKVKMVEDNGMYYIEINDVNYLKEIFGQLLSKVQAIKSTGNFEAAKELVMTYGTKVNQQIHAVLLEKLDKLNMPKVFGFITPLLVQKENTVIIKQSNNFFEQQLSLFREYNSK